MNECQHDFRFERGCPNGEWQRCSKCGLPHFEFYQLQPYEDWVQEHEAQLDSLPSDPKKGKYHG